MANTRVFLRRLLQISVLLLMASAAFAQETTGGLQGTVKDPSGAVVSNAHVSLVGSSLVGEKTADTDSRGYYRFANLPPGTYTLTVTGQGFSTIKRDGMVIEVGHLPTVDLTLEVGTTATVVEVNGAAPAIDVTTETTQTNVTSDVIQDVPHGRSFQSVIQFAPSARNEPLMGGSGNQNAATGTGTGGQSPGSGGNGGAFGFQVGGGSDSENSYLVEGQETADSIGGFSHTNVPFDFIQEVQVKSSGVEAEHGGALGGVVNVIMKKGSNGYHGSIFTQFENDAMDGGLPAYSRYDPQFTGTSANAGCLPAGSSLCNSGSAVPTVAYADAPYQQYQPRKDKFSDVFPGFTIGGPLVKDKLWFFAGFNPEFTQHERLVNMGSNGVLPFSRNQQTYYSTARIDAAVSQRVRLFGSWLYQYQRETGESMPFSDSTTGLFNPSSTSPPFVFAHNLGYAAPNVTTNVGADFTLTPRLVATVRWGYTFQNYHDFGYPTGGVFDAFGSSGVGAVDNLGKPIPANSQLSQTAGYFNVANNINTTGRDATHRNQLDTDLAWFKSGWLGTHNFKFGYQLNRLSNDIYQHYNEPNVNVLVGAGQAYNPQGSVGKANCASYVALYGVCAGLYGYLNITDYGSLGKATSVNHGFFFQDAWTVGHGLTINAGLRVEKEYLPAEQQPQGGIGRPINFGWGDKIAPRIGAAWDVFRDGRMKVFGSYGVFNDIMKLNLAISSFGGQFWQNCFYALDTQNLSSIVPTFDSSGRYCVGPNSASQANFGGATPAGITFLENQNFRTFPTTCSTCTATEEGVAPGLKPYRQHESVFGVDYQLRKNLAFEARWDRRRLDHAIEDSAIFNPAIGETFVIVNPGQGVNKTFDGFWNFLYGSPSGCATAGNCPPKNIPAARSYDGAEFRLTKTSSDHWFGMVSYTYSHFRGNYSGLTTTDLGDALGRNAPNNSRAFDEPFFSWTANGTSSSGLLPTDRPSAFKGYAYYEMNWKSKFSTDIGIFQFAYSGSPLTSYLDAGYSFAPPSGAFPTEIVGRGKWVDVSQDANGVITVGNPRLRRTSWFTQTDLNFTQNYKLSEDKVFSFFATIPNVLNQRAVTAYNEQIDTNSYGQYIAPTTTACGGPCAFFAGYPAYLGLESPYNWQSLLNNAQGNTVTGVVTINSQYGKPYLYQLSRNIRVGIKFTF
ncbi:MAG: hypothetical protein NVS1B11_01540 [Terriglobales bacterium]